jgi:RND family efflux transporter MFP subunit
MKRAVVGVLVVALVVVGFLWWNTRRATASPVQYLTATAARSNVTDSVAATGTVQPQTTLALSFGSTGTSTGSSGSSSSASASSSQGSGTGTTTSTVSAVNVAVGQHVDAGAVLATVDGASQQAAVTAATGQLAVAQAQVTSAQSQLSSALARLVAEPSVASVVAAAKSQLATAQAQLTVAEAQLAAAQAKLAAEPTGTTASQLASDDVAVAQGQAQVVQAQGAVQSAQHAVTTASTPSAAVASDNSSIAQARLSVTQAQNGVTTATSSLAAARVAAASTSLTAPIAGIVTAVDLTVGTGAPSGTAVQLRSDGLQVVASVAELDITKLKAGLIADVTFPALGSSAKATLVALPTQANSSTGGTSSAVTFPVDLQLATAPPGLLPGMSAQISITIASQQNVLAVPTTAIQGSTASPTVQVMVNGVPQTRPVTIGLSTASTTEIVAGLNAGDTVVTGVVNPLSTTTGGTGGAGGIGGLGGGTGGFGGTTNRTRTGG